MSTKNITTTILILILLLKINNIHAQIKGKVFRDYNSNGVKDNSTNFNEIFLSGVTVTAFGENGITYGPVISDIDQNNDGYNFSLPVPNGVKARIEFSSSNGSDFSSPIGNQNNSNVQFITAPYSNANYGMNYPMDYISSLNPKIMTSRFLNGSLSSTPPSGFSNSSILSFNYNDTGYAVISNGNIPSQDVSKQDIGSVWGLAFHRQSKQLFSAAFVKRHVSLKDGKKGVIYKTDYSTSIPSTSLLVDLEAAPYNLNLGSFSGDEITRGLTGISYIDRNLDKDAFIKTGRVGLGSMSISDGSQRYLYTTNLSNGKLIKIDLGLDINNPLVTSVQEYALPSIAVTNGELRSFAVKYYKGKVYVGAVATGEYESGTSNANLFAYVFEFNDANNSFTNTPIITIPMNTASYPKGYADYAPIPNVISQWYPWSIHTSDFNTGFFASDCVPCKFKIRPQPQFAAIEFGEDGSMIMSFIDRTGNQLGYENDNPDNSSIGFPDNLLYNGVVSGDILRAVPNLNGTYILENNGVSGGLNGGVGNGQGPGGGEFFYGDYYKKWNQLVDGHQETVTGGIAYFPGKFEIISNNMDLKNAFLSGSKKFSNIDGSKILGSEYIYDISAEFDTINWTPPVKTGGMGKVCGLGDLEFFSEVAPIEIGNFVWKDENSNGLQDAEEQAIPGATVSLYMQGNSTPIATAITDINGNYLFSNRNFVSNSSKIYGLNLLYGNNYEIKLTNLGTSSIVSGLTINEITVLINEVQGSNNSGNSLSNNDGYLISGIPTIPIKLGFQGENNHNYDFGIRVPKACIGNYIWHDLNQDGIQNNGEVGVSGVTVSLISATNTYLATVTSDAYGYYQFCGLDAGDYKVQYSLPANYVFTTANNGSTTDALDSDPSTTTGLTAIYTLAPGDSNMTADAGIYQPQPITATVGDRVWFDADGNGTQDGTENGVSGITVSLFNCSNPTTPIATTITDANGNYIFENVAPGSYSVTFTAPTGTTFTTQTGTVSTTDNSDVNANGATACFPVMSGDKITYVDAGIVPQTTGTASLGDKVWNDADQDGIQDPTETGVAGVTVTLYDATGITVIGTTTTDGLGNYGFNGIAPGCYVVGFAAPSGYTFSTQNAGTDTTKNSDANATTGMTNQVCVAAGQNNPTIDAGVYNNANTNSIGDKVWYDVNHDGLQDPTEYGYPGVVVTLYDCTTNAIVATTTTNANGNYLFDGLANGDYYVGFGIIPGFQFTGANSDVAGITGENNSDANPSNGLTSCVNLAGNTHITTVDAGIYPGDNRNATSTLGDIVWTDVNKNGLQDNGETGVPNVIVTLYAANGTTVLATTTTDGLGNYIFTNLDGGNYVVGFDPTTLPAGYTFTTKGTNIDDETNSDANTTTGKTDVVALGLGEDKMTVDAGVIAPSGTVCLGDYVWIDLDNNGTQNANEPAVPGVTVKLYDNNTNTVLQVATTDATGKYLFCGLTNGSTYSVGFENLPAGFTFTTSTGTLATTDNSDANPTTGRTTTVTMGATNDLTLDAGIYSATTAVVGNYVWYDEDADGIQDATEAPIAGVLVTLYDNTNTPVASAVTDAKGGYLFTNVTPGDYTIGFAGYPSTLVPTTKGTNATADDDSNIDPATAKTATFNVPAGSSNLTLDAGFKANPIAGLGNYVWNDVDQDGLQDASEPAIAGVVVTLYAADGTTTLATAITDGNGAYSFPNLTAGTYVVGFSNIPTGFTRTQMVGTQNDALNSDILSTNKTTTITLAAGTYNPNIDAGFYFGIPLGVKELKATTAIINAHNDTQCNVNWFTTDEQNTSYFTIERSIDNKTFEAVGNANANNTTTGRTNYTYQDNVEAIKTAKTIYYRIRLTDIDGKETISNVINTKQNSTNDAVSIVYPVPFTNIITIDYPSTKVTEISIKLTDISGKTIRTLNQEIEQGNNTITLGGLEHILSGTYFLRIVNNNTGVIYSQKLTK